MIVLSKTSSLVVNSSDLSVNKELPISSSLIPY